MVVPLGRESTTLLVHLPLVLIAPLFPPLAALADEVDRRIQDAFKPED